jgi:pilus assembly protein Flp/PilA
MRELITRFAKDEDGAALVEYGLLVGLIAVVCITAVTLLGTQINEVFTNITADLTAAGIKG